MVKDFILLSREPRLVFLMSTMSDFMETDQARSYFEWLLPSLLSFEFSRLC